MMARTRMMSLAFIAAAIIVISCTSTRGANDSDEELADRAQQLGYVAVAVDAFVKFGNPPATLTGEQLILEATRDNPDLLRPLEGYFVTARHEGRLNSVLMCDVDKRRALAEDAGCTSSRIDALLWKTTPTAPCSFTLNLEATCGASSR